MERARNDTRSRIGDTVIVVEIGGPEFALATRPDDMEQAERWAHSPLNETGRCQNPRRATVVRVFEDEHRIPGVMVEIE